MATLGKMNTDLVGATGFQLAFYQWKIAEIFERSNMSHRSFTNFWIVDAASTAVTTISHEIRFDRLSHGMTVDDGPIYAMSGVTSELPNQSLFRLVCSSHDQ